MAEYKTYEYIWLDGYTPEPNMRSKVKATEDATPPDWSFDGSSTQPSLAVCDGPCRSYCSRQAK
jgi:hypothetical protein